MRQFYPPRFTYRQADWRVRNGAICGSIPDLCYLPLSKIIYTFTFINFLFTFTKTFCASSWQKLGCAFSIASKLGESLVKAWSILAKACVKACFPTEISTNESSAVYWQILVRSQTAFANRFSWSVIMEGKLMV